MERKGELEATFLFGYLGRPKKKEKKRNKFLVARIEKKKQKTKRVKELKKAFTIYTKCSKISVYFQKLVVKASMIPC